MAASVGDPGLANRLGQLSSLVSKRSFRAGKKMRGDYDKLIAPTRPNFVSEDDYNKARTAARDAGDDVLLGRLDRYLFTTRKPWEQPDSGGSI